ncbi:MAG: cyclic nucleotide-binding domain-containing protein [Deltaproteobacteria bacterium]|jgi:CRP-like cAMP-binding protein|nr:cyclic nucleotide-binding domain-containing protein [Deltaproteobacteria bacterium]MBW2553915.1 cyclic nucleotide-binding domain-containing protein [Deltaproteobacteria bacterium]
MAAIEDLKNNEFFKGIPDSDIKEILPFCKKKSFDTGINICTHGVRGKEFFLLLDGRVELKIPTDKEYGLAVVFAKVGDAFGFSGLLEPHTYTSMARCVKRANVIAIEMDPFLDFIYNKNIKLGFSIMKNLALIIMNRLDTTLQNLRSVVSQVQISIP